MKCHICGDEKITHYRQKRSDGVWVVTARCANDHIPEKGRPFYPISQFNLAALPVLDQEQRDEQPELFQLQDQGTQDPIELFRNRSERFNKLFPPLRKP